MPRKGYGNHEGQRQLLLERHLELCSWAGRGRGLIEGTCVLDGFVIVCFVQLVDLADPNFTPVWPNLI